MEELRIYVRTASWPVPAEVAAGAYKNIEDVVVH
jgi:hypothetical protein